MGKKQNLLKRQAKKKAKKQQKRNLLKKSAAPAQQGPQAAAEELPENYNEQVDQLTSMAMSIIYDEKNKIDEVQLPQAYEEAQQKVQYPEDAGPSAIADTALWVLDQIEQNVESRGKQVLPIVVMGALGKITIEVADLATAAGLFELSEEDIQIGISTAANKYIPQAKSEGKFTDQELQQAAEALQKEYPEEVDQFNTMLQERNQRLSAGGGSPTPQGGMEQQAGGQDGLRA